MVHVFRFGLFQTNMLNLNDKTEEMCLNVDQKSEGFSTNYKKIIPQSILKLPRLRGERSLAEIKLRARSV